MFNFFESYSKKKGFNSLRHIFQKKSLGHIQQKNVQFFESHSKSRFNSLSHIQKEVFNSLDHIKVFNSLSNIKKGSILWLTFQKVQFFESWKKKFNSLSHVKRRFNSLSQSSILWIKMKKSSVHWVIFKKRPVLWVVFPASCSRRDVQFSASCSRKKVFNSLSHICLKGRRFNSLSNTQKGSILCVTLKKVKFFESVFFFWRGKGFNSLSHVKRRFTSLSNL